MVRHFSRGVLPVTLILIPPLLAFVYVSQFVVNVPFWDEWSFVPFLQNPVNADWFAALRMQQGEYRPVIPRLVLYAVATLSNWNQVTESYFNLLWPGLSLWGLWLIYKRTGGVSLWGFVPVAWIVFSLGQGESLLWGWMIQQYLITCGAIWTVYFLLNRNFGSVLVASLCAIVPSLTSPNGLLLFPVGLFLLVALRVRKRLIAFWTLVGLLVWTVYFVGYVQPTPHPSPLASFSQPGLMLEFFLANVGAPLGEGQMAVSILMGLFLISLCLLVIWQRLGLVRAGQSLPDADWVWGSFVIFSLLSSAAITVGRVAISLNNATFERYTTVTYLSLAGLWMILLLNPPSTPRRSRAWSFVLPVFATCLIAGLAISNLQGIAYGRYTYITRTTAKYALQRYETQPDEAILQIHPQPSLVRQYASFLKSNQLSSFNDPPIDALLLTSRKDPMSAGEIQGSAVVIQSISCPVNTLKDFEVNASTFGRQNKGQMLFTLAEGDQTLEEYSLSMSRLIDNDWLAFDLARPITSCLGHQLRLTIQAQTATPGNAITVWTFPRYYEGELVVTSGALSPDRTIGLELNARSLGVLGGRLGIIERIQQIFR